MSYRVETDDRGEELQSLSLFTSSGDLIHFSPLDVAYTIAQNYKEALVGGEVYISKHFPMQCMPLQLDGEDVDVVSAMYKSGANFYFDAQGIFVFKDEVDPNPQRAGKEFYELYQKSQHIYGPSLAVFEVTADKILVQEALGNKSYIYLYSDE